MVTARLERVDKALDEPTSLTPLQTAVRRSALLTERANLTGRDDDAFAAEDVAGSMLESGAYHDDLVHTRVQLNLNNHDVAGAAALLTRYPRPAATTRGRLAAAGVAAQRGDLVTAATTLNETVRQEPSWQGLAAIATVFADLDDVATADRWYALAADDIDALQMWSLAWVEVTRARMWRGAGDLTRADRHLDRAEAAWLDWRVREERGRWLLGVGRPKDAVGMLRDLAAATDRPDHHHLLGDACARDDPAAARDAYQRALDGYRSCRSATRYRHHLAEFHLRVSGDPEAAVELARQDAVERPNRRAGLMLATSLAAAGDPDSSATLIAELDVRRDEQLEAVRALFSSHTSTANADDEWFAV